jgi:hypothetical protein
MNSRKQGDLGSSYAIAYFSSLEYTVSIPLSDSQPYDLIVEKGGICQRVQVKTCFKKSKHGKYNLETRTVSNTRGQVFQVKRLSKNDFDIMFVMDGDGKFYVIPSQDIDGAGQISLAVRQQYVVQLKTIFGSDANS